MVVNVVVGVVLFSTNMGDPFYICECTNTHEHVTLRIQYQTVAHFVA